MQSGFQKTLILQGFLDFSLDFSVSFQTCFTRVFRVPYYYMPSRFLYWLKTVLIIVAFAFILAEPFSEAIVWTIPLFLIIGYLFGKATCSQHLRSQGIWITLGVFAFLNGIHSVIDGTLVASLPGTNQWLAMLLHEVIRQPLLYIIVWELLAPFARSRMFRIAASIVTVTGTWIAGMVVGGAIGVDLGSITGLHPWIAGAMFILAGDVIHHLIDEYRPHTHH